MGSFKGNQAMNFRFATAMCLGMLAGVGAAVVPSWAQAPATPPVQSAVQSPTQNSEGGPPPPIIPGSGLPGTPSAGVTTAVTPVQTLQPGVLQGPGLTAFYGQPPVGRGFPGMPGGPPLNGPMGAQDLSGRYMTPPVLGPTVCDLATLGACD